MLVVSIVFIVFGLLGLFYADGDYGGIAVLFFVLGLVFCLAFMIENSDDKTKKREYIKYKIEEYKDSINQIQYQKSLEQELYKLKDSLQQIKNK